MLLKEIELSINKYNNINKEINYFFNQTNFP